MARIDGLKALTSSATRFPQAHEMYAALQNVHEPHFGGMKLMVGKTHLNDADMDFSLHGVPMSLRSKRCQRAILGHNPRVAHRLFAECDCGKMIPFGRVGQHRKVCNVSVAS